MSKEFLNAVNELATVSSHAARVNLVDAANADNLQIDEMTAIFELAVNNVMQDKAIILNQARHSDTPLYSAFKKSIQRHNTQVLWRAFRPQFETDGQTSAVLGHVKVTKEGLEFEQNLKMVKVTAYGTYNNASANLLTLSAKVKNGRVSVTVESKEVDVIGMMLAYEEWKDSLTDYTPVIEQAPAVTLVTNGDIPESAHLQAQLRDAEFQHATDTANLVSLAKTNSVLDGKVQVLTEERDRLQALVADYERELAFLKENAPKQRKRA